MFDGSSGQSAAIREAVPLFQQVYKIIRGKCPQWHEGNVQLMGVYLAITFLEYGLNSQTLGVDGQRSVICLGGLRCMLLSECLRACGGVFTI